MEASLLAAYHRAGIDPEEVDRNVRAADQRIADLGLAVGMYVKTSPPYAAPWSGRVGTIGKLGGGDVSVDFIEGDGVTCGPDDVEVISR